MADDVDQEPRQGTVVRGGGARRNSAKNGGGAVQIWTLGKSTARLDEPGEAQATVTTAHDGAWLGTTGCQWDIGMNNVCQCIVYNVSEIIIIK